MGYGDRNGGWWVVEDEWMSRQDAKTTLGNVVYRCYWSLDHGTGIPFPLSSG